MDVRSASLDPEVCCTNEHSFATPDAKTSRQNGPALDYAAASHDPEIRCTTNQCDTGPAAEPERCCRFCLDGEHTAERPLIAPCKCKGTMKHVHRDCLDQWRVSSFNPKVLVQCSTCGTPFQMRTVGLEVNPSTFQWWVRLALDVVCYFGFRLFCFLVTVSVMGFSPNVFAMNAIVLHANPLANHMLVGMGATFATTGVVGLLLVGTGATFATTGVVSLAWHMGDVLKLFCDMFDDGGRFILIVLILLGLVAFLCLAAWSVVEFARAASNEVMRAAHGANEEVRRRVVKEYVILNLDGGMDEVGR